MGFIGVNINKLNGGLEGENANTDRVFAVAIPIPTADLPTGLVHYVPHRILQVSDAEDQGLTASFDGNNDVMFNQQFSELFRLCPDAVVYLIAVPSTLTVTQLVATEAFLGAIRLAKDVKGLSIAIPADVTATFAHAEAVQAMVNAFALESRLIDFVILPARGNAILGTIADYPDFRTKNAPNVTPCIAQDPAAASVDAAFAKYADWGSALGMLAVRKISENAGSVDIINKPSARKGDKDYPLTGTTQWLSANLSSGVDVGSLSHVDLKSLTDKGYMYAGGYDSYGGIFFNSSPTAVEHASDYAFIERNCVWNKAARLIRTALMPYVNGKVKKDPSTGYIKITTIVSWRNAANKALETLKADDDISGYSIYINPKQVLSDTTPIKVKATVVSDGISHEFDVDLGLANKI